MLVSGNDCLLMPNGLHPKSIENIVLKLLEVAQQKGADLPDGAKAFQLLPIADKNMIQRVREEGVKKIHLNVGQYLETARDHEESYRMTIGRCIGRHLLEALFIKDEDRRQIEAADNVSARVVISLDGRRAGLQPEKLIPLANDLAFEDEEHLEIETKTGQRIKGENLVLKKGVKVRAFAKTVAHEHAWDEMREYWSYLAELKALEE